MSRAPIGDFDSAAMQRRNREAAEMLRRVGRADLLQRRPGGYAIVPPEFDQQTVANLRRRLRGEASHLLTEEQAEGQHLLACHIVHPRWQAPLGCLTASRLTEPKGWLKRRLTGVADVTMGVGAVDLNFGEAWLPAKRLYWSPHIHAVLAAHARILAAAKALVQKQVLLATLLPSEGRPRRYAST